MDNLGDWLYIVFLAIAGLSSLLSSKKKKKRPSPVSPQVEKDRKPEEEKEAEKGFWEVLQEIQQPKPEPKKKQKPVVRKKQKAAIVPEPVPFLSVENEIQNPLATESFLSVRPEEETNNMPDIELNTITDLRKAVIYAEILNRKY